MRSFASLRMTTGFLALAFGLIFLSGCATQNDSESDQVFKRVDLPPKERVLMKNQIQQTGNYSALGSSFRQNNSQTYRTS